MRNSKQLIVGIIDDDEAIRESLHLLLFSADLPCQVYASADEFLSRTDAHEFSCLLLDIRMPGTDGLELFRILQHENAPYPVLFITGHGDIPLAVSAIKQGAFDFLTKPFKRGELLEKVKSAITHCENQRTQLQSRHELKQRVDSCTPRERDVMQLMVRGMTSKSIADNLAISPRTVEIHRAHVMEKMQAASLPALVQMLTQLRSFPDEKGGESH